MAGNSIKIGGNASGAFVAGNNNRVNATVSPSQLPDPSTVRITDELAGLRSVLSNLSSANGPKIGRALDDADDEIKKDTPNKDEVGSAVERALKVAKEAGILRTTRLNCFHL
ncbi:MAG TPA: hypothetical protein VFE60_13495 [Roseiarcus sp.]|nr:hypothetical protein [Roseiarcus sp.]